MTIKEKGALLKLRKWLLDEIQETTSRQEGAGRRDKAAHAGRLDGLWDVSRRIKTLFPPKT